MATGDQQIIIYPRKLLSFDHLDRYFLDYLTKQDLDFINSIFRNSGVFDAATISSDTNDTFDITPTDLRVCDNQGHIIQMSAALLNNIPFWNDLGSDHYVGIKYESYPDLVEVNAKTGDPEYVVEIDSMGERDEPDLVTNLTGPKTLRIRVDSVTENNNDHSGKTVRVWLKNPVSPLASVAFWEGTSVYSSPNNYVDIPYTDTAGPLGQNPLSISTDPTDYQVFIKGVTWKIGVDLSTQPEYAYIGSIYGNGPSAIPTSFDHTGQQGAQFYGFAATLDSAYDGATGAGSGRVIVCDSGPVEINNLAGGDTNDALKINKVGATGYAIHVIDGVVYVVDRVKSAVIEGADLEFDNDITRSSLYPAYDQLSAVDFFWDPLINPGPAFTLDIVLGAASPVYGRFSAIQRLGLGSTPEWPQLISRPIRLPNGSAFSVIEFELNFASTTTYDFWLVRKPTRPVPNLEDAERLGATGWDSGSNTLTHTVTSIGIDKPAFPISIAGTIDNANYTYHILIFDHTQAMGHTSDVILGATVISNVTKIILG